MQQLPNAKETAMLVHAQFKEWWVARQDIKISTSAPSLFATSNMIAYPSEASMRPKLPAGDDKREKSSIPNTIARFCSFGR